MTARQRVEVTRSLLVLAASTGVSLVFIAIATMPVAYAAALASVAAAGLLWRWRGVFSLSRVTLWLEERLPELRYALVSLRENPDARFRDALEAQVRVAPASRPVALALVRLVGTPAAFLLAMQLVGKPLLARTPLAGSGAGVGRGVVVGRGGDPRLTAIVTPPAYSRLAADTIEEPTSIAALVGSDVRLSGAYATRVTMPARPTVLRLGDSSATGAETRLVALEPRIDSVPRVVLSMPARDSVLPLARGVLQLAATLRDDIGLTSGWFEMIVSSGDGETFQSRSAVIARTNAARAMHHAINAALRLDTLGLVPGAIVHIRAVARDANPSAEPGVSETRTLRVYRRGEDDSVAVEAAPPPEVERSELSQRMLIIMTEQLVQDMRRISRGAATTEAATIAQEQGRLRRRVGAIIFTRLTGDEPEPDDTAGIGLDTLPPGEALLARASAATQLVEEHTHEETGGDGVVIGINQPLLEAFNAMWEAERELGIVEPNRALPHMRAALAAIQRARAAERLYLRGRAPRIVIDINRIRLSGKKDGIDPAARTPRASALAAALAQERRFHAALDLLAANDAAGIDSLTVLRVDALAEQPALAAALGVAIDRLRSGRNATDALLASRRALAGEPTSGPASRWSGQ